MNLTPVRALPPSARKGLFSLGTGRVLQLWVPCGRFSSCRSVAAAVLSRGLTDVSGNRWVALGK